MSDVRLFPADGPEDLVLRGFSQDVILERTGIDVGYHGNKFNTRLKGIDRFDYKVRYVLANRARAEILSVLDAYAAGLSKAEVLDGLGIAGENIVKLHKLFKAMGYEAEFRDADKKQRLHSMRTGTEAKYGTDNVFKLAEFQEQAARTRERNRSGLFVENSAYDFFARGFPVGLSCRLSGTKFHNAKDSFWCVVGKVNRVSYGRVHVLHRLDSTVVFAILADYGHNRISRRDVLSGLGFYPRLSEKQLSLSDMFCETLYSDAFNAAVSDRAALIRGKIELTNMSKYGGVSPMSSDEVRCKVKATTLDRYGVDNVSKLDVIKQKKCDTVRSHFGVESPCQSVIVRTKAVSTVRERYGVDNVSQSDVVKQKKMATCLRNFGVPWSGMSYAVRVRALHTLAKQYGYDVNSVKGPFSIPAVREKARMTCLSVYGVANPFESGLIQSRIRATCVERYGVENPSSAVSVRLKREQTMLDRYGVINPFQYDAFKVRARATNFVKYGVEYVSQSALIQARANKTRSEHHTFSCSSSEEMLYARLVARFGEDDVFRQYASDPRYPFLCDFYVRSRDLFIELNGTWTHGGHWYDGSSETDRRVLDVWAEKASFSAYYASGIETWSVRDVMKRSVARDNGLNYVVFWDHAVSDAGLWFAMDCPDGRDWDRMYSWLPTRDVHVALSPPVTLDSARKCICAARFANGQEVYKNELAFWRANDPCDVSWGTPHMNLYVNRYKYLNKLPSALSDMEILRGLSIGFFVAGYSAFDISGMARVFDTYGVSSVYDPCAGWGERLVYCGQRGLSYFGCDINPVVVGGHACLVEQYGFLSAMTVCADSARFDASGLLHDVVFTCPPYGDTEVYTDLGAENLSWSDFLVWWDSVVRHAVGARTRIFAYQIDQKHKVDMNDVLIKHGWRLIETIQVGVTRVGPVAHGRGMVFRKNFEEIQVFSRDILM